MGKEKTTKKHSNLKLLYREHKKTFIVYWVLRMLVLLIMIRAIFLHNYENVALCLLTLVLFCLPSLVKRTLRIELPSTLEIIVLLFIFSAEILGEIGCFYVRLNGWDTMMHTINGFLCAAIGFSLVEILNREKNVKVNMSPLFMAVVAFCFSMTIGVLWEFVEFGSDMLLHSDMQKDTVIHEIYSVSLDPTNSNIPIALKDITDVTVNGQSLELGGYLDIGLRDTMKDLGVNFIGAVVFSVMGFFYMNTQGEVTGKIVESLVPSVPEQDVSEQYEASKEEEDRRRSRKRKKRKQ